MFDSLINQFNVKSLFGLFHLKMMCTVIIFIGMHECRICNGPIIWLQMTFFLFEREKDTVCPWLGINFKNIFDHRLIHRGNFSCYLIRKSCNLFFCQKIHIIIRLQRVKSRSKTRTISNYNSQSMTNKRVVLFTCSDWIT